MNVMELKEEVLQKFPYRCPYCDQPVSYDSFELKEGENSIQCPSCLKTYVRILTRLPKHGTE
jgi:DNA-directed RNA polymerase subunit RPC12/RpoP